MRRLASMPSLRPGLPRCNTTALRGVPGLRNARWCASSLRSASAAPEVSHAAESLQASPHQSGPSAAGATEYNVDDVVGWLQSELALDIRVLDVRGIMDGVVGDWLVFATARSTSHMKRLAETIVFELKQRGVIMFGQAPTIEGAQTDDWMLVDGGKAVVNIMIEDARQVTSCPASLPRPTTHRSCARGKTP